MRIPTVFVLATGIAALAQAAAASAQALDRYKVIVECTDTINRYAHTRDQLDADGNANLFTEDGIFESGATTSKGREAIARRLRETDPAAMTRHMSGSVVVTAHDDGRITALSYFHVFQAQRPASPAPVPASSYLFVEYHDDMRMTSNGCKIAKRAFTLVFMGKN